MTPRSRGMSSASIAQVFPLTYPRSQTTAVRLAQQRLSPARSRARPAAGSIRRNSRALLHVAAPDAGFALGARQPRRAEGEFDDGAPIRTCREENIGPQDSGRFFTRRSATTIRREMEHSCAPAETRRLDVSCVYVAPDQVMVHADDVTELRESEERLRAVFAGLESGLLTIDPRRADPGRQPGRVRDPRHEPRAAARGPELVGVDRAALRGRLAAGARGGGDARRAGDAAGKRFATSRSSSPAPTATS